MQFSLQVCVDVPNAAWHAGHLGWNPDHHPAEAAAPQPPLVRHGGRLHCLLGAFCSVHWRNSLSQRPRALTLQGNTLLLISTAKRAKCMNLQVLITAGAALVGASSVIADRMGRRHYPHRVNRGLLMFEVRCCRAAHGFAWSCCELGVTRAAASHPPYPVFSKSPSHRAGDIECGSDWPEPCTLANVLAFLAQVGSAGGGSDDAASAPLLGDLLVVLAQFFAATQFIGECLIVFWMSRIAAPALLAV